MMKRKLETDYLSWYYETKENLESAHKRQRIFAHPTSKSKLLRSDMYQYIENHNSQIDTQINGEINKLIGILRDVIIDNDIAKLQELISHGILNEMNDSMNSGSGDDNSIGLSNSDIITEVIGCVLQYNREEALLIISPFIDCQYFDINKFDKPMLSDPYKIILFLHSNKYISLRASHCKLFHKAVQYGHYNTVKYCLDNNVPVDSCEHKAIREAARYGHLEIVKLLHLSGGNIHQYQDECLRKAARHGHLDILSYLICSGGNIHCRKSQSLIKSVENGHCECADLLIKSGLKKHENISITKYAVKHKQYECLSLLLKYGYVLWDEKLRLLALSALYGVHSNNKHQYDDSANVDYNYDHLHHHLFVSSQYSCYDSISSETESSVSPPLSPQYSSPHISSDASVLMSYNHNNDLIFNDDDTTQRFLDAISEGLALRETMFVSVLSHFIYQEIAYIICSFEKLALTQEDEQALKMNKAIAR